MDFPKGQREIQMRECVNSRASIRIPNLCVYMHVRLSFSEVNLQTNKLKLMNLMKLIK